MQEYEELVAATAPEVNEDEDEDENENENEEVTEEQPF